MWKLFSGLHRKSRRIQEVTSYLWQITEEITQFVNACLHACTLVLAIKLKQEFSMAAHCGYLYSDSVISVIWPSVDVNRTSIDY